MWQSQEMDLQDLSWKAFFRMLSKSSSFHFFTSFCLKHASFPAYFSFSQAMSFILYPRWARNTPLSLIRAGEEAQPFSFVIWCHRCHLRFAMFESLWIRIITTHSPYLRIKHILERLFSRASPILLLTA